MTRSMAQKGENPLNRRHSAYELRSGYSQIENNTPDILRGSFFVNVLTERVQQVLKKPSGWETFTRLNNTLSHAVEYARDALSAEYTESIIALAKQVEQSRLAFSARQFAKRYTTQIVDGQEENEEVPMSKGTQYIRSHPVAYQIEYYKRYRTEFEKDMKRNDSHWGYPDPVYQAATYRNAYNSDTGEVIAISNFKTTDEEMLPDGCWPVGVMYCSEIIINQIIASVKAKGADPGSLNFTSFEQDSIVNTDTLKVVRKLVEPGETKIFSCDSHPQECEEVLRTPNCKAGKHLIRDYRYLLGDKAITSIKVNRRTHDLHGDIANITLYYAERPKKQQILCASRPLPLAGHCCFPAQTVP